MAKELVGHHLLRVRIRKKLFDDLQQIAEEESERTGMHVTVSDLVRAACSDFLLVYRAVTRLENAPPMKLGEVVTVINSPLL